MGVNDTTWGKSFEEDGVKMRMTQSSLVDPIHYTEASRINSLIGGYTITGVSI